MLAPRSLLLATSALASVVVCAVALDTYDVVVVGSGPGGLVAAEFLSRDPSVQVLVLEAGGLSLAATGNTNDIPAWLNSSQLTFWDVPGEYSHDASIFSWQNKKYTIDYVDDRSIPLAQLVGGCSTVNAALYFRVPDAFVTNTKWPFDAAHVSQRYDEIESEVFGATDLPSMDGQRYLQEAYSIVSRALSQGGFSEKTINDAAARNNKSKTFGHTPFAFKNGERDSPAKTCWGKMRSRSNVKLLTGARVSYIKHTNGKAMSVVYNGNVEVAVSDRGAVVMAAGALGTPKVLIQSGIGPSDQLNGLHGNADAKFQGLRANYGSNGDGWIVNENVGKNLFDTNQALGSFTHDQMKSFKFETAASGLSPMQSDYVNSRKGPLTTSGPVLVAYDNYIVQGRLYEFQLTVHASGFSGNNDKSFGGLLLINNPESRDSVSFDTSSGKYLVAPAGTLYMATGRDLAALQDFSGKIVDLLQQQNATLIKSAQQSVSDWVAGNRGSAANHYGGTCFASSDVTDLGRCADDKLRVIGSSNIYVSDASAIRDGTVNPYGFIMYVGREVGNLVRDAFTTPLPATPILPIKSTTATCPTFTVEKGIHYSGYDLDNAKSPSADGCCSLCSSLSGCAAFSWTNYNGGTCWLKSRKGPSMGNAGSISGYLPSAVPTSYTSCPVLETGVDYSGADVGNALAPTATACCSICEAKLGCGAFTWTDYNGGTCWLKSSKGTAVPNAGATSAVLETSTCEPIEENIDFGGADVGNALAAKAEDCCELCHNKDGCGAYSWNSYNGGTCWLKSGKGTTKESNGVRSGVVTKAP